MKKYLVILIYFFAFSNVNATATIETNERDVNDIYLTKIVVNDYLLTAAQLNTLHYVANQCPFAGGRAVFLARAILKLIGDSTVYDDDGVCSALGYYRKANAYLSDNTPQLLVTPNPANNIVTFYYTLNGGDIATIEITDAVGFKNKQLSIAANSFETSYNFSNASNGIYTCNLICNNKIISTCKLVIIK